MTQALLYRPAILGLAPYSPYGKRRELIDHIHQVLDDYRKALPLTVRQIYYRLVATHDRYPKDQKFYRQLVDTIARARRGGLIDFDAIRDDGIVQRRTGSGFDDLDDFSAALSHAAATYTRDRTSGQPQRVFVLTEAAGMVPQIHEACAGYPVTIRSSGGMDGVTAKHELAQLCARQDSVVLHVGDFDPSGLSIYHQLVLDVGAMIRDLCAADAKRPPRYVCKRIGVLAEQVGAYGLLTGRIKPADEAKDWYPGIDGDAGATCEAEAFPPDVLMRLVRDAVAAELDHDALADVVRIEERERRHAMAALSGVTFGDGGGADA